MSLRIDSTEWISGALIIGETGLGVLGSAIPATGDDGPGYAYNDLSLPADANKEICGRITTWPALGTLTVNEDTSFDYSGPNGVHTFSYQLYVDGVSTGSPATVTLEIGIVIATGALAALTLTAPAATASGVSVGNATGTGALAALTLTAPTATASGVSAGNATGTGALSSLTLAAPTATASAVSSANAIGTGAFSAIIIRPPEGVGGVVVIPAVRRRAKNSQNELRG